MFAIHNAFISFLDLEAGHSGRNGVCDNTNADESQGSLADFIYDENSSGDDQESEVDMATVYLTSLLPISQQPEDYGFHAPKYSSKGFKLRKKEFQHTSQSSSSVSPQSMSLLRSSPLQPLLHTLPCPQLIIPSANLSVIPFQLPLAKLSNRMRLQRNPKST